MVDDPLISYAQNAEDVVLWRALGHVHGGVFVDVGGWDPDEDSVTRLFYERGWRGIDVEPVPEFANRFRERRPLDHVVQAAITDEPVDAITLHRFGMSGLSTLDDQIADDHRGQGLDNEDVEVPARRLDDVLDGSDLTKQDIHFLKIDVEGVEEKVLRSIDLSRWRPWVLVVEATAPNSTMATHTSWESDVVGAGYVFALFDGLSRFYVAAEHPELLAPLSYPACVLDGFVTSRESTLATRADSLVDELGHARAEATTAHADALRWRRESVNSWASAIAGVQRAETDLQSAQSEVDRLRAQLIKSRATVRQVRGDRKRLRTRVDSLNRRIDELERAGRLRTMMRRVVST